MVRESRELVGAIRAVRDNPAACFTLMRPAMEQDLAKLAHHPLGETKLCVNERSMPVGHDRGRDGFSHKRFKSCENFIEFT